MTCVYFPCVFFVLVYECVLLSLNHIILVFACECVKNLIQDVAGVWAKIYTPQTRSRSVAC